jgi:tetratricopeptide (TPR) repeat protein
MSLVAAALLWLASGQDLARAIQHQKEGRWEEAASAYREALERAPADGAARIYLAETLWFSGRAEEARKEIQKVREQLPSLLLPALLLARFGGEKPPVPEAILENAMLAGEAFVPVERAAVLLAAMGEIDRALGEYRLVAEIDPKNASLHRHLGNAFFKASRNLEAIEAYESAVALEPGDAASWGQLGSSYLRLQWWDKAIAAFEKARSLSGDQPGGILALAYAYERKPELERALSLYRKASELAPRSGQAPYRMGRTLMKLNRREEAARELKRALEIEPGLAEARCFLGALYLEDRDLDSAIHELETAISMSPRYAKSHFYLAQAYQRAGRGEEAKTELALYEKLTRESADVEQ